MNNSLAGFFKKRIRIVLTLFALALVGVLGWQQQASAQGGATLVISAPKQVDVGQPIPITLRLNGASDIAGYEMNVRYDSTAAHLYGVHQRDSELKQAGRDIIPLQIEQSNGGMAIGLASCNFSDCVHASGASRTRGGSGNFQLATVLVGTDLAGPLEIRFDSVKFVDAAGNAVPVTLSPKSVTVQVGQGGTAHPAKPSTWQLAAAAPTGRTPAIAAIDRLRAKKVTHSDVMEFALAWTDARSAGAPCGKLPDASLDLNGDGCIDVADVQIAAAHEGAVVASSAQATAATKTWIVNTANDSADSNPGDGICQAQGGCTLRAAIDESNAYAGPSLITFNIPGSGVQTINLKTNLPTLGNANGAITIDGYTQPGASANTDPLASNAVIKIQLNGQGPNAFDGIRISSAGNLVRGLALYNLRRSFLLYGSASANNSIVGNFIGTDAAAQFEASSTNTIASGVYIDVGANSNHIGTSALADRNVISGNARHGIATYAQNTNNNVFQNNIIGLSPDGTRKLRNFKHGIDINSASSSNLVGGTGSHEGNILSGDGDPLDNDPSSGVEISHDTLTTQNKVFGNCFGTTLDCNSGNANTALQHYGLRFEDGVNHNEAAFNVIGNTKQVGVNFDNYNSSNNWIHDNRIGISANGTAIANGLYGVRDKYHASNNKIGPNNIIANNPTGMQIEYTYDDYNTITQNSIYANTQMGIDLGPAVGETNNDAGDTDTGANEELNHPIINTATTALVKGTACGDAIVPKPCTVEIFIASPVGGDKTAGKVGQGKTFVGSGTTDSNGKFAVTVSGVAVGALVTATATDASGNTSEFSYNLTVTAAAGGVTPTPTPPSGSATLAADSFDRTVSNTWGKADKGGAYTLDGNDSNFDVNTAVGTIRLNSASADRAAYLDKVSTEDSDALFKVAADKTAKGAAEFAYWVARHVNANSHYLARVRFAPNGSVHLQAFAVVNGSATALGREVTVQGLKQTADGFVWMRARVNGTSPTTIKLKAWADGQAEPADWLYTVKDSTAALQNAGSVGLRTSLGGKASNTPVRFSFDDLVVSKP